MIARRLVIACFVLASGVQTATTSAGAEVIGPYQRGQYSAGDIGVRYFSVAFSGNFNMANIRRAAEQGMRYVQNRRVTHITGHIGRTPGRFNRHIVVGEVSTNGTYHWTAVRVVGRTNCEWVDCQGQTGFSGDWVRKSIRLSNGKSARYQFGDDDKGGFVWEMKN